MCTRIHLELLTMNHLAPPPWQTYFLMIEQGTSFIFSAVDMKAQFSLAPDHPASLGSPLSQRPPDPVFKETRGPSVHFHEPSASLSLAPTQYSSFRFGHTARVTASILTSVIPMSSHALFASSQVFAISKTLIGEFAPGTLFMGERGRAREREQGQYIYIYI